MKPCENPSLSTCADLKSLCVASRLVRESSDILRGEDEKVIGVGERAKVVGGEEDKVMILAILILHGW